MIRFLRCPNSRSRLNSKKLLLFTRIHHDFSERTISMIQVAIPQGLLYLIMTREEAKTRFDEERLSCIEKRWSKPVVEYYKSRVIVNNVLERIEEYD